MSRRVFAVCFVKGGAIKSDVFQRSLELDVIQKALSNAS